MSPREPAIVDAVALTLVRKQLTGLRGYNDRPEAEALLAAAIQETCISVDHARAVLATFDHLCPTPREIKDTAHSLRPKFEPPNDRTAEWKKQYGPPDPGWSERLLTRAAGMTTMKKLDYENEKRAMHLQAIRDAVYYTESVKGEGELSDIQGKEDRAYSKGFWQRAQLYNEKYHPEWVEEVRAGRIPAELRPLEPGEKLKPRAPLEISSPPRAPITAEDIARVTPAKHESCPQCRGTGRLAFDEYCTCPAGEDLRKVENPGPRPAEPADEG